MLSQLTYRIDGIEGIFRRTISKFDRTSYICTLIKKDFGIVEPLSARLYGSDVEQDIFLSDLIREEDIVTFHTQNRSPITFYRQPQILPRYTSDKVFVVYTTLNYQSMTKGDYLQVDLQNDTPDTLSPKIKSLLQRQYSRDISQLKKQDFELLLYLPGGIPFVTGTISEFVDSFPDYVPHLYCVILQREFKSNDLEATIGEACNLTDSRMLNVISPYYETDESGLCQMACLLGYIQRDGLRTSRMIYSLAKFCPFPPLICGLYQLCRNGSCSYRSILQITSSLSIIFIEMSKTLNIDRRQLYSNSSKFLTFFMNVNISSDVPCTQFSMPYYNIGYERYLKDKFEPRNLDFIVSFDPDFRNEDWIRFELPNITQDLLNFALKETTALLIVPPLSLREMHRTCLFTGIEGSWLFIPISKNRDTMGYINPLKGTLQEQNYEKIAFNIVNDTRTQIHKEAIDPDKVAQLVYVCVDHSGSMKYPFPFKDPSLGRHEEAFTRLVTAKLYFEAFVDSCYTFHTSSKYGCLMFDHEVEELCSLQPFTDQFVNSLTRIELRGATNIFGALHKAAQYLIEEKNKIKYPNAISRILLLTDGCECPSTKPIENLPIINELIENEIRVDAVIIDQNAIENKLVAVTHLTGGDAFTPATFEDGIQLFNNEEFFDVNIRQFRPIHAPLRPNELNLITQKYTPSNRFLVKQQQFVQTDSEVSTLSRAIKGLSDNNGAQIHQNAGRVRRILRELRIFYWDPDPETKIYPLANRVDIWRVLIKGVGEYYENYWYYLTLEFPDDYPEHYPFIRFVAPPYHPNVTDLGRICIDKLEHGYAANMTVRELIGYVRGILLEPNFSDPVDLIRHIINNENPTQFRNKVNEYHRKCHQSPEQYYNQWRIEDLAPDDTWIDKTPVYQIPEGFLDPITNRVIRDPVKATSRIYYERKQLENYISKTDKPVCFVTGLELNPAENTHLQTDLDQQSRIMKWANEHNYRFDDAENDIENEEDNIRFAQSHNLISTQPQIIHPASSSDPNQRPKLEDLIHTT